MAQVQHMSRTTGKFKLLRAEIETRAEMMFAIVALSLSIATSWTKPNHTRKSSTSVCVFEIEMRGWEDLCRLSQQTVQTTYLISLTSLQFTRRASTRTFTPSSQIELSERLHVNIITVTRLNNVLDTKLMYSCFIRCPVYTCTYIVLLTGNLTNECE